MKKIFALFLLASTLFVSAGFSQVLSNCSIVYSMDIDGPEMNAMAKMMMAGSKTTISFLNDASRVHSDMKMMNTTIISTDKSKKSLILMSMMGMKKAAFSDQTAEELDEKANVTIKKTGKTKDILGYNCEEVEVTTSTGDKSTLWVTDKIMPKTTATQYSFKGISGFPLEMTMASEGNTVKMKATKVDKAEPEASLFSMKIPAGYTEMTMEEMEQMGGGK